MKISDSIKDIRNKKGLSQQELADRAGIAQTSLSQIENGIKSPNVKTLEKLCKGLNIPVHLLFLLATEDEDIPDNKRQEFKRLFPDIQSLIFDVILK